MVIPYCAPADGVLLPPARRLPIGAIDTHFHVFGPEEQFPYAPQRTYTPPDASNDSYLHLARVLGIAASVIVQPSVFGSDNSRTLTTLASGLMPMRAVVVLNHNVTDGELEDLHGRGVRGIRINTVFSAEAGFHEARLFAGRIRELGWHVQFLTDVSKAVDFRQLVDALGVPVVLDHYGHFDPSLGTSWQGFQDLLGLMADGKAWVKFSGAYRSTKLQATPYDDIKPIAAAFLEKAPAQIFWGSDWPHPSIGVPMPNDGPLVDMLMEWVNDEDLLTGICVDNPQRFYGFSETEIGRVLSMR